MGGNIQKGKSQSSDNSKKSENQQILQVKDKDLKHSANLGNARWYFTRQFLSWEVYNALSEEEKQKVYWIIFTLEISNEIERSYINSFPYENNNKMIFFDNLQQKHVLLYNKDNALTHYGLIKREEPNKSFIIKNEANFLNNKQGLFTILENSVNSFQYNLINNLAMICYEHIFSFFNYEMCDDNLIKNFLSTTIICSQRLFNFINFEYQEYIKFNFVKYKNSPFSLITLKSMLLFDFSKDQIYLNYFLNDIDEKDFDIRIMNMFLEYSNFSKQIIDFPSTC